MDIANTDTTIEPFCGQPRGLQDCLQDGDINYREWGCGFVTIFTADYHIGKEFRLVDGALRKNTLGNLGTCQFGLAPFTTPEEFAGVLGSLKTTQCMTASTPHGRTAFGRIVVKEKIHDNPGCLTRGKVHFGLIKDQRSIMTIDYDPGCTTLSKDELWGIAKGAIPGVESAGVVYHTSSSSWIYKGGELLQGLRGQRLYILVQDAGDIARSMGVLQKRLWLAGHGRVMVAKGGAMLLRTPADATLKEDAKLDYAGGPVLRDGLEQRRPAPEVLGFGGWLDTSVALPDLTPAEVACYDKLVATAKQVALPESQAAKAAWTAEHVRASTSKALARGEDYAKAEVRARETAAAALSGTLPGDFEIQLDDGVLVTVGEVLDDRAKYHKRATLDPLEPEYLNRKVVGKLYLYGGVPRLYSFAHGGCTYKLARQPEAVTLTTGRSALTAMELVSRLAESGDVFVKGGVPVRVLDGPQKIASPDAMGLELGTRFATFRLNSKGESTPADISVQITRFVVEASKTRLKPLRSYVKHPFVTESELVTKPGYHEPTGVFAEFDPTDYQRIPLRPSKPDVVNALKALWRPFEAFAFASKQDRAACLAAILAVVCRPGMDLAPGILCDAPVVGSGKTLLASTLGALSEGKTPSINLFAYEPDIELKKTLISSLLGGSDLFLYDNVMGNFNSPTLAGCVTSGLVKARILNVSLDYDGPGPRHLYVTSNNASLGVDLSPEFDTNMAK